MFIISRHSKHLAITGAGGFIGNNLLKKALDSGWKVTAIVRNKDALIRPADNEQLRYVEWDIKSDISLLDKVFEDDVDLFCHLAAFIPPDMSSSNYAEKCFEVNALGTLKLVEYCSHRPIKRLIYFSSGNVYKPTGGISSENDLVYPFCRGAFYLISKLAGELFVENIRLKGFNNITSFRISSVYGPGMKKSGFGEMLYKLLRGSPVLLYNGGRFIADFVYVDDVVDAIFLAEKYKADGLYNIGSGELSTIYDATLKAVEIFGQSTDLISFAEDQSVDCNTSVNGFNVLDVSKAGNAFNYKPMSLHHGLEKFRDIARLGDKS